MQLGRTNLQLQRNPRSHRRCQLLCHLRSWPTVMLAVALEQSDHVRILTMRTAGSHWATISCAKKNLSGSYWQRRQQQQNTPNIVKNSRQRTQDKPHTLRTLSAYRSCPTHCSQHSKARHSMTHLNDIRTIPAHCGDRSCQAPAAVSSINQFLL